MILELLEPIGCMIVAEPRWGRLAFGVPPGGPFDCESADLANALVGNPDGTPVLEIVGGRLAIAAMEDLSFGWVGAKAAQGAVRMLAGEFRRWEGAVPGGCRSYIALPGGVFADPHNSRSFHSGQDRTIPTRTLARPPNSLSSTPLRIVRGDLDLPLPSGPMSISPLMDRKGVRITCKSATTHKIERPSEPCLPGVVQLPPDGNPIIIGPDGPTIGGYPRAGVVIRADLDKVGQLACGDEVEFDEVSVEFAQCSWVQKQGVHEQLAQMLRLNL